MSGKIEISRDLLARAYWELDAGTPSIATLAELCALLARTVCSKGILCGDVTCECKGNGVLDKPVAPVVERQPSAWLHTMFMELDQRRSVPTLNPEHPFGICGRDFSPTYTTQSDPLFTQPPAPAALTIPDECPHLIVFDDTDREQLMFAGTGARSSALKAWAQISTSWNAHLFVRVERNSRDDRFPSATTDPLHQQLADVTHQRDLLVEAISAAAIKAGIVRADMEIPGPALLMLADDMADTIINLNSVSAADQ